MRALGYVLIAFNLIAAGAFLYFGIQDYKGRTETNGSVQRHILYLRGVPFEGPDETTTDPEGEVPLQMEVTAGNIVTAVPPKFLENYFKDAPVGDSKSIFASVTPMPSQLGEFKRVRNKVKEVFDAATTPQQKTKLLKDWLELGVESYTERALIQKAVEKNDWGTLSVYLDMRFQQISPAMLQGGSAPLSSEHWEKLASRIETLEAAMLKADGELKIADDEARKAETAQKKAIADLLPAANKLVEAEKLLERAKKEQDVKLETAANADIAALNPIVKNFSDIAKPLLLTSADKTRVAEDKQRKVDEIGTELSMLRRSAVPDADGRMTRLAHLLVHLDADAAWQKRVMLVVGLRKYVKVVAAQARRFQDMVGDVEYRLRRDQETYTGAMGTYREQALQRTRLHNEITASRKKLDEQKTKDEAAVAQRKTQLADLETQLAKIKADVATLLAEQTSFEQELFILQREIAVTLEEVYALQDELREAEKARFSIPK